MINVCVYLYPLTLQKMVPIKLVILCLFTDLCIIFYHYQFCDD